MAALNGFSWTRRATAPRVLICDFHVGCQLWQAAALEALGVSVKVLSLSAHAKLLPRRMQSLSSVERRLLAALGKLWGDGWHGWCWPEDVSKLLSDRGIARYLASFDCFVCGFPPSLATVFFHCAQHLDKRMILNAAHRWDMGLPTDAHRVTLEAVIRRIHESDRHVFAVMSEYDWHYVRYSLGIEAEHLPVSCHHIPLIEHAPTMDDLLVGPVHARRLGVAPSANDLDAQARQRTGRVSDAKRWCIHIRDAYPNYSLDDLRRHRGVILFPYSAFSISMVELYELNLPTFVPSPRLLVEHALVDDRVLFPMYGSEEAFLRQYRPQRSDAYASSPNSYEPRACFEWFRYCYFFQKEQVIRWDSVDELVAKVESTDLAAVRERMHAENLRERQRSLQAWRSVIYGQESRPAASRSNSHASSSAAS